MPIYEFHCPIHQCFELLMPVSKSDVVGLACPTCGETSFRVISLPVMKPDSLWAGHMTDHGYVTSSSKLASIRRDKNIEVLNGQSDVDAMKREAEKARAGWDEKLERDAKAVFEEAAANTGIINSFGELTPEATDTWRNDRIHQESAPVRKD